MGWTLAAACCLELMDQARARNAAAAGEALPVFSNPHAKVATSTPEYHSSS